ncbi:MAG TPA: TolC family outer membrane protein [Ramlibacter sp.]|nr:TolC family outer membrane protein [Ramlibacter sp.]
MNLAEAWRLALDHDATIRGSRAAAEAGRERLPQARAQLFPQISASASRNRNDLESTAPDITGRAATSEDKYTSSSNALTIRQPLFRPQLTAQVRQAQALALNADKVLERDLQTLVTRVTEAYFQTLLAEEQLALIGVQKAAYTGQLDAARKGFAAGAGTRTDIDEAQARLDLTVAQELEARQNVDLARRQLQVLINRPVDKVAAVDVKKLPLAGPGLNSIEEWTQRAEAASPELQSLAAQAEAARHQVDVAKAGHLPTLDAIGQISRSNSENITRINSRYNQKQLGLQLQVPIFQGGYVNSQVREALAREQLANETLEAGRRDLGVRVHKEFRGVTEGVLKVRALEQAVRSAEQLVTSSNRSFQAGARTRIDILNAEQQLGTARRDLAQARFMYLISRVRLKALAGELMPENIDEINGWLQN